MFSGCLMIDCLRSFCLVKSRGFAHLAALGLVSIDCQNCRTSGPYRDAQDRLLWRDKHVPSSFIIIIINTNTILTYIEP
jgi:hypothetical protein